MAQSEQRIRGESKPRYSWLPWLESDPNADGGSVWQTALWVLGTLVAVVVTGFFGMGTASVPLQAGLTGWQATWHYFGMIVAVAAAISMAWRTRYSLTIFLINCVAAILLPLSPFGPAITMTWSLARCSRKQTYWGVPLGIVAVCLPFWRDYQLPARGAVLATGPPAGPKEALDLGSYLLWSAVFVVVSLAVGFARRWRRNADRANQEVELRRNREAWLSEELSRKQEREAIAQEIHDTVAHQLSLVSLHAGALEMTATDPTVPEAAQAMRTHAHTALEELRSVIKALRNQEEGYTGDPPSFASIRELVEGIRQAGKSVDANIEIAEGAESASPSLKRATYRIVQESLTNALKHAPDSGIGLNVVVEPENSVSMSVTNWLADSAPRDARFSPSKITRVLQGDNRDEPSSARAGLLGMSERASALGGKLSAGPDGDRWIVRAWLPWMND